MNKFYVRRMRYILTLAFTLPFMWIVGETTVELLPLVVDTSVGQAEAKISKRQKKRRRRARMKRRRNRNRAHQGHSHGHGHGHGHGGHDDHSSHDDHSGHGHNASSGFSMTAGASVAMGLGGGNDNGENAGGSEGQGHTDHSGHSHLALQSGHEGHDHSGGGEGGGAGVDSNESSSTGGLNVSFNLSPAYAFNKNWSLNSNIGFTPSGLSDPTAGIAYNWRHNSRFNTMFSVSAAAPLSEFSQKNKQITAVTAAVGPTFFSGKWSAGVSVGYTKNIYAEPLLLPAEDNPAGLVNNRRFSLQEDGHDHSHEDEDGHDHEEKEGDKESDHDQGEKDSKNEGGHDHDHGDDGHDHSSSAQTNTAASETDSDPEENLPDRQSSAINAGFTTGYQVFRSLQAGIGLNLTAANSALGKSSYITEARLLQLTYLWNSWNLGGWFSMTGSGESISAPNALGGGASFGYSL